MGSQYYWSYIGQDLLVDGACGHGTMHRVCSHILGLSSRDNDVIYHTGMGRLKSSVGVVICVKQKMPLKSPYRMISLGDRSKIVVVWVWNSRDVLGQR